MLLRAWSGGNDDALDALIPLVERELRSLAKGYMRRERPDHTLQTTALVNEAFVRLVGARDVQWRDRAHFLGIAARLMRRVLVDHARTRQVQKRGGGAHAAPLDEAILVSPPLNVELLALDRALNALATRDERKCHVVEMRYFAGMTVAEIAVVLRVSEDTVKRDWRLAKLLLLQELGGVAGARPPEPAS